MELKNVVTVAEGDLVQIIKEGDSLFGKAFSFVKTEGEHLLVEIKSEGQVLFRWLHHSDVQPIANNNPSVATVADVHASTAAVVAKPTGSPATAPATPPAAKDEHGRTIPPGGFMESEEEKRKRAMTTGSLTSPGGDTAAPGMTSPGMRSPAANGGIAATSGNGSSPGMTSPAPINGGNAS